MTQYGFYFDSTRCTGCRTCQMACKDYNDLGLDVAFRKVVDFEGGSWTVADDGTCATTAFAYHVSAACNHCANPACVAACPQGSMVKDEATGLVFNDPQTCIGCGACALACPYGAPVVDAQKAVSVKCHGCHERVVAGKAPVCVEACPLRALEFGAVEELAAAHPEAVDAIAPLPEGSLTAPSLLVNLCPAAAYAAEGAVANPKELACAEPWA